MIKIIPPGSYDFHEPVIQLLKVARDGLKGQDRRDFVKRAGSDMLRDWASVKGQIQPGEELAHLIAMGDTERFGPNRNLDAFSAATCRDYHHTFEKYARAYRSHLNKDPHLSYGRIIKSAYHEPMGRVELLVAYFGTKQAAGRYKALVADKELEKLASDQPLAVSMACLVPNDKCSWCGNLAPTTKYYCTDVASGGHCKAGGLRDNIGAIVEIDGDTHQLHADNPAPRFFDISNVWRPADRIAYVTGLLKSASVHGVVKSAELAQQLGVTIPMTALIEQTQPAHVQRLLKCAYQLAAIEEDIERGFFPLGMMAVAGLSPQVQTDDNPLSPPSGFREKFSSALKSLADIRAALPLCRFVELVCGSSREKAAETAAVVGQELPNIHSRCLLDPTFATRLAESPYTAATAPSPATFSEWAAKQASDLSLRPAAVQRRVSVAAIRDVSPQLRTALPREKAASADSATGRLAEQYAMYQLGFLATIPENDPDYTLTTSLLVLQNHAR